MSAAPGSPPQTPYLLLDKPRLEANIGRAAGAAAAAGVDLRPHVKTHKSARIARMQLDAGAVGITVATVGEAEVFAAHGCRDIFVAYPVWVDGPRAARVAALVDDGVRLSLGVDSVEGAAQAAASLSEHRGRVPVRVEVDSGQHRSGAPPAEAGTVARAAADAGLAVEGVFTFPGHSYGPGAGGPAADDEAESLGRASASFRAAGVRPTERSGGSTPSLGASLAGGGGRGADARPTELRPGVYALGDAQQWELGAMGPADIALCCVATVVSRSDERVVLDAGSKVLGADRAPWATGFGRLPDHPDARVVQLSEHHAVVEPPGPGHDRWRPGSRVRIVPNHVCAAVNLADVIHVDETGRERPWPVDARGRNA